MTGKDLKITAKDIAKQIPDITITNTDFLLEKTKWKGEFYKLFAETTWQTCLNIFGKSNLLNLDALPRQKRQLNTNGASHEAYPVLTPDNVLINLTRYNGGPKGPLLCTHGLAISSAIYTHDTISMNFVEFFGQNGYDVWVLDDRQSILLATPPICHKVSVDGIAKYDIPAAINTLLEVTGKKDLLLFAHCQGGYASEISIASGSVKGKIRAFVMSQAVPLPVGSSVQWLKSIVRVSKLLEAMGMHEVTAYTDTKAGAFDTVLNWLTKGIAYATTPRKEHCNSAVCHRITGIFGYVYQHKNLSIDTHDTLHELFGLTHASYCHQMLAFIEKGKIVDKNGEDIYIPGVDSKGNLEVDVRQRDWVRHLDIPIYLLIGAENQLYSPMGVQRTYEMLQKLHPDQDYVYAEIPGYGQIDTIFGEHAARDVWPGVLSFFDKYAEVDSCI